MVMLSQLLRCKLVDAKGKEAKLSDVSVDLLNGDYPPVTRFYFLDSKNNNVCSRRMKCSPSIGPTAAS